jgi:hypothetical protein
LEEKKRNIREKNIISRLKEKFIPSEKFKENVKFLKTIKDKIIIDKTKSDQGIKSK